MRVMSLLFDMVLGVEVADWHEAVVSSVEWLRKFDREEETPDSLLICCPQTVVD